MFLFDGENFFKSMPDESVSDNSDLHFTNFVLGTYNSFTKKLQTDDILGLSNELFQQVVINTKYFSHMVRYLRIFGTRLYIIRTTIGGDRGALGGLRPPIKKLA